MARRIITAPAAAADLRRAREWLLQPGSGPDARRRWAALRDATRLLLAHPYAGSASQEHRGYRELKAAGHRIIYRLRPDTGDAATAGDVEIARVFGPGQLGQDL